MTIEIHGTELEALIRERMKSGEFESVEELLLDALHSALEKEQQTAMPKFKSVSESQASRMPERDDVAL